MKKIILLGFVAMLTLVSCDKDDELRVFDNEGGQTALSFQTTSYNVSVPTEDLNLQIPVSVTTVSNQERTFTVAVDEATNASEFTAGNVVIPAGQYEGNLTINFDFSAITGADGETKTAVFSLVPPAGGSTYQDVVEVVYFREIVCNDPVLSVTTDFFASETGFFIENSAGVTVFNIPQGSFPNGRANYTIPVPTLPDGSYTITITDAYSDGQQDGTVTGSYSLDCSIINLVTAGGAFGASQTRAFEINP
ncbi:hypothetical protein [Nonlabens marinus]|uniref:Endonuclease I n=1 Tax=Nonlabens marinus S1-08 TaxID=1454201 RepID=W8VU42_9FLAO|nr:hypothetical protein [Nonlabens marinus]BAO54253.1 endonuclease I [Nonlabens marinus S1-08]